MALFCATQSERGWLPVWAAGGITISFTLICGTWLGFTWSKPRIGSLIIRSYLIALLFVGGYSFGNHPGDLTKKQYQAEFILTVQSLGMIWFSGWTIGMLFREVIVTLYISDKRRTAFRQGWGYRLWTGYFRHPRRKLVYLFRLGVNREDRLQATIADIYLADAIADMMKPSFFISRIGAIVALVAALLGAKWLVQGFLPNHVDPASSTLWEWSIH